MDDIVINFVEKLFNKKVKNISEYEFYKEDLTLYENCWENIQKIQKNDF